MAVTLDFESGTQGFSHSTTNNGLDDPWDLGNPSDENCRSGNQCWATNLTGNYHNCDAGQLVSPVIDLSACAGAPETVQLKFWHLYRFEQAWDGEWFDGGALQISSNGGASWEDAAPTPGYQGQLMGMYQECGATAVVNGGSAWSGTIQGDQWTQVTQTLGQGYMTANFQFRLIFGADSMEREEGWYVDDAEIAVQ